MTWSFNKPDSLPDKELFQWENLLEKRTSVQLAQLQQRLLRVQVSIRMHELGIDNYKEYFDYVRDDSHGLAEWQVPVDCIAW